MELSASKIPRIEVVDALRGFAVMAIILVHNLEHFIFPVYPTEQPTWLAVLNDGVFNVIFSCLQEKLMLFSLFCSGLHSISNVIIRKRKEKTSATASYGDWFCCLASQP